MQRFNTRVDIIFHSKRYRLADPDGASGKALLDGIVKAEILEDDSAKFVRQVSHTQEKIKKPEIETTTVTITEV